MYRGNSDVYRVLVGNLRERDHLKDPGIDGRKWDSWGRGLELD
jgi:hypothetical protein